MDTLIGMWRHLKHRGAELAKKKGRGYSQAIANIGRLERTKPNLMHFIWGSVEKKFFRYYFQTLSRANSCSGLSAMLDFILQRKINRTFWFTTRLFFSFFFYVV